MNTFFEAIKSFFGSIFGGGSSTGAPKPPASVDPIGRNAPKDVEACHGNVWLGDIPNDDAIIPILDLIQSFGGTAVRYAAGGISYKGGGIQRARLLAQHLEKRGMTALLGINGPNRDETVYTYAELFNGGRAWGAFFNENPVHGKVFRKRASVGNEPNLHLSHYYKTQIAAGKTPDEAWRLTELLADQLIQNLVGIANGVHSVCPTCKVASGGLGGIELRGGVSDDEDGKGRYTRLWLAKLAPYVQAGVVENALDAHLYRTARYFVRNDKGQLVLREDYAATIAELLATARWPAGTRLLATEMNVGNEFGTPEETKEAMIALHRTLYALPNMTSVCPFSIFKKEDGWTHIAFDSPLGEAVREASPRRA